MPVETLANVPRPRRHFGRRHGPSLSARQEQLFETLLPQLALRPQSGFDPRRYFLPTEVHEVCLEVGFGGGEHLLWQAETHPGIGLLGAEPYISGVAKLLSKLADRPSAPSNIRIYMEDAGDIIEALPDASLARVFILFPDPWPKTRHHKRRFIQMAMLDQLARVMKHGAEIRFATDDNGYLVWALERFSAHAGFRWPAEAPSDWRTRVPDWPQTRYEAKAKQAGSVCTYLRFIRT